MGFHNVERINHCVDNIERVNRFDQVDPLLHSLMEVDWVPFELRQLFQNDLQVDVQDGKRQNFFAVGRTNEDDPDKDKQRRKQTITINIDPDALLNRVKRLRNPHKALYKKVLKRNHKLKLRAMRQLRKRRKRRRCRGKGVGRERKYA